MIDKHLYSIENQEYELCVIPIISNITEAHMLILTDYECEMYTNKISRSRKAEFVSARVLLFTMLGKNYEPVQYHQSGKPFMKSHKISISHTKQFVAAVVSKQFDVAIDIEMYRPTIQRIATRFMNTEELQQYTSIEDRTIVWSAKEVLYKMYNASADFALHYHIDRHVLEQTGKLTAHIHTQDVEKTIELSYFRTQEYCMVWGHN